MNRSNHIKRSFFIFMMLMMSNGVFSMSLSDEGKVCLFSKISGVITIDGEPVANAKLVRTVNLTSAESDETRTDDIGNFDFPAVFSRTITKYLPQEFASNQEIVVHYEGKEYRIWSAVKRKPGGNIESRGKPLVVSCELNSDETLIKVNNSPIFSLCKWDVEPDKKRNAF